MSGVILPPEDPSCYMISKTFDALVDCYFSVMADYIEPIVFYSLPIQMDGVTQNLPLILIWLACASLFLTIYFRFINLRFFRHAIDVLRGKYDGERHAGEITSFQALTASLSGTVGLGNIAGVAIAVSVGGPGAVFWMVVMGFLGMSSKFMEVALGVKYRQNADGQGEVFGGPMYYIKPAFEKLNLSRVGICLSILFAIFCVGGAIGGGNLFQSNQAYQQVLNVTGGEGSFFYGQGWVFGLILAFLTGIVTLGGVRSIGKVTAKLVPFMVILYIGAGLIVIFMNVTEIPHALGIIFREAFTPEAGIGALIGAMIQGIKRASFSNEAGLGTAAIVYAATKTESHIQQGFAAMMGPFIDTVVICLITALVIVITGAYHDSDGLEGVTLTSRAFGEDLSFFPILLAISVCLFAYSTLITWSYYAEKAMIYLLGNKKIVTLSFRVVFLAFIVMGCSLEIGNVVRVSESLMFLMAIPNVLAMYILLPEIRKDLKEYISRMRG